MTTKDTADVHVSPSGDDRNPGTFTRPLATLAAARDAVRKLTETRPGDVLVQLRGGVYRQDRTVVFTRADSPPSGARVTYAAMPGERPVLSAGLPVDGWEKPESLPDHLPDAARGKIWTARVPTATQGEHPPAVFVGDRPLPRARSEAIRMLPRPEDDPLPPHRAMYLPEGAIGDWPDLDRAEAVMIPRNPWTMSILPVASYDNATGVLTTALPCTYPLGGGWHGDAGTVWIENTLAVLDRPGEWVFDPDEGILYVWPPEDKPPRDVVISRLTEIIRIEGNIDYDGPVDQPVNGLTFRGLTFCHGGRRRWHGLTGWGIQHDWEAFDRPTAMVRFRGAEHCSVERCRFAAADCTALRLDLHCRDILVTGNLMEHLGGCGVVLCGYGPGTKDANNRNAIENNHIHHIGRTLWHSPAVFVWQSGHNRIARNHIHDTPYTAVVVSGRINWDPDGVRECSRTVRWDELRSVVPQDYRGPRAREGRSDWLIREPLLHGRGNVVEGNDIHHVMQVMGDGNCIYISGTGRDNMVRHNRAHDCPSPNMCAAIRCDDDQHDVTLQGNLIHGIGGTAAGIAIKGVNHLINNIIACPLSDATQRGLISLELGPIDGSIIRRNVLFATSTGHRLVFQSLIGCYKDAPEPLLRCCDADGNLYWNTADPDAGERHLRAEREHGVEINSRAADPCFRDPDAGDFGFDADSPAPQMGIEPVDLSLIGPAPDARVFE